jgi:hypothetical protein
MVKMQYGAAGKALGLSPGNPKFSVLGFRANPIYLRLAYNMRVSALVAPCN